MKLISLVMEAFGPYLAPQKIDFSPAHKSGLFLVQGPTGSGKSTILDAICFCLYDVVSGDKKNDHGELRCHLAPDSQRTAVCLEFELAGKHYRAQRSFGPKKSTTDNHQCLLELRTDQDTWQPLYSRISDAGPVVAGLLGLRHDQFRQVILLPQGKFREFLTAPSNVRSELLKTLFNTNELALFMELLKDRCSTLRTRMLDYQSRMKTLLQSLELESSADLAPLRNRIGDELALSIKTRDELRSKADHGRMILQKAIEQHDLKSRIPELERRQGELLGQKKHIESRTTRLALARRVEPVVGQGSHIKKNRENLALLQAELAVAVTACNATATELARLESQSADIKNEQASLDALSREREGLEKLMASRVSLDEKQAELAKLQELIQSLAQDESAIAVHMEQCAATITEFDPAFDGRPTLQDLIECSSEYYNLARNSSDRGTTAQKRLGSIQLESGKRVLQRAGLAEQKTQAATRLAQSREQLENLKARALLDQALTLRAVLHQGQPCPVCGSLEHPAMAPHAAPQMAPPVEGSGTPPTESVAALLSACEGEVHSHALALGELESRIKILDERILEDQALVAELSGELATEQGNWTQTLEQLLGALCQREALARMDSPNPSLPEGAFFDTLILNAVQQRMEGVKAGEQQRSATLEAARTELSRLRSTAALVQGQQQSAQLSRDELSKACDTLTRQMAESISSYNLDSSHGSAGAHELRKTYSACVDRIRELSERIRTRETDYALAHTRHEHALADRQDRQRRVETLEQELSELQKAFDADLAAVGFKDIETARLAYLKPQEMETAEQEIQTWHRDLHDTEFRLREVQTRLDPHFDIPPDQASAEVEQLDARLSALGQETGRLQALDEQIRKTGAELDRVAESFRTEEAQLALHDGLLRVLNGKDNKLNIDLERYALSVYLDEVLQEANQHLDCMSRGRYQLERTDEGTDKRKAMGLDINIMDAYTGKGRSGSSLSGGESFMAALSLALGLSTVVHRRSGGVRLDTLLIDEGFGSLDEEALQDALSVLSMLKEKGQVVGIISHVRELQERIGCRLLVQRSPGGSSLSWAD